MFAAISIQIQQRISLLTPISCSNSEQIATVFHQAVLWSSAGFD